MAFLLDSGFQYALLDETDEYHQAVTKVLQNVREEIVLPIPAITEITYFLSKNLGAEASANFLDTLPQMPLDLETPTPGDFKRAAEILRQYDDANIDFVDALIVAIAERLNITKILTIDQRHFGCFAPRIAQLFKFCLRTCLSFRICN